VRGQELLMEPSIEITYDPTIKVRGITEELFKQQPEGKFVLKPFTIISKKVYKNFTDRSHAFNYLLKFLKKKSKEDNNVILRVFSEPGKIEKLSSFFFDTFKVFKIDLSFLYKYLRPLSFISSIKFLIEVAVTFNNILSKKEKRKLEILELWRIFFIIIIFSGGILFANQFQLIRFLTFQPQLPPFFSSFYLANIIWGILFLTYIIGEYIVYKKNGLEPFHINNIFNIHNIIKEILNAIEKSKVSKSKNFFLVINFDILSHFDFKTSLNFIQYLLTSITEHKNISIIFHAQYGGFIYSIKEELIDNQANKIGLFFENGNYIEEVKASDIDEYEANLPIHYNEYRWAIDREKLQEKNKKLERENKEQLARIIQSAKLESMNITTSGVSHEMRNPLSIIQLVIENLRMEKNLTKEVLLEDLDKIQTQISRIYKLTETFQKFSAQKNLTKKSIDTQITNSLYFFEQRLLSNKIEVNYDKPEESIGAIEFSEELSIVIENLISNAIDALKGNPDAKIGIRINLANDKLEIKFSDNGHGIPQESIKEIFTPLYTTKGPGQGTGLGLWLCYTIVKDNLKGDIRVDSPPNEGTTFTILLPIDGDKDV
jgi:signal transduction histidine kinase